MKGVLAGKICGRRVWEVEFCAKNFQEKKQEIVGGEALNEFVADPLRHRQTDRQTDRGVRVWGAVNSKKNRGLVMQLS